MKKLHRDLLKFNINTECNIKITCCDDFSINILFMESNIYEIKIIVYE